MTPEQLAARWLADVPASVDGSGVWIEYDDALAAIARHLAPEDDLVAQATAALEGVTDGPWKAAYSKWEPNNFIVQTDHSCRRVLAQFDGDGDGPDGQSLADARFIAFTRQWVPEAAARIAALTATVDGLKNDNAAMTAARDMLGRYWTAAVERADAAEAENATLRARLARMEGAAKDAIVVMQEARSEVLSKREDDMLRGSVNALRAAFTETPADGGIE